MLPAIPDEKEIVQHNAITSARYDLSACQLDILFVLLASLKKYDSPRKPYAIHIKDIEKLTGRNWNYKQFQDSVSDIGQRTFFVPTVVGEKQLWPFDSVLYLKDQGSVEIILGQSARQYFFDLKDNFTVMQLKSALSCSSKYAKRLYSILCQWRSKGTKTYKISTLKEMLFLKDPKDKTPEQFSEIPAFRKKVLDIAKNQINETTDMEMDYELMKTGRSFTDIKFVFGKKKVVQPEIDFKETIEHQMAVSHIKQNGLTKQVAEEIVTSGKYPEFVATIDELNNAIKAKKIKPENHASYLYSVLKNKGILKPE